MTFTSASSARFFHAAAGTLDGPRLVSIGPVTSDALRELGLEPDVEAAEHTPDGLVAALVDALQGAAEPAPAPARSAATGRRRAVVGRVGSPSGSSSRSRGTAPGDREPVRAVVDDGALVEPRAALGAERDRRAGRRVRRARAEAGWRRAPRALGRDYAGRTRCRRASVMRATGAVGDGSAGRRRLALRRDAGHRAGPALGLVLALRARLGHAERLLLGLVGRQPAGASSRVLGWSLMADTLPGPDGCDVRLRLAPCR